MLTDLRILILEDSSLDVRLEIAALEEAGYVCHWKRVETELDFLANLNERMADYDLILADYSLPSFDGLTALRLCQELEFDLPFILVSGTVGEEIAVESLKAGATDYVLKQRLERLPLVVERALREKKEQRQRRRAEAALRESEEKFRIIFQKSLDVIMVIDGETGQIRSVNQAIQSVLGYREENLLGEHFSIIFAPVLDLSKEQLLEKIRTHGPVLEAQYFLRVDGSVCPMDITATMIPWDNHTAILATFRDVTEREAAAQALRLSEERFRATFEQAAVGIAHVGTDGRWLRINQKLGDMLGYSHKELLKKTLPEVTHAEDLQIYHENARRILAGELETCSMENRFLHQDGAVVWGNLTISLLRSATGKPQYFIVVIEDITGRKKLEEQFLHAQKMEAVGRLAGGVAHDFNNLLTVINGYTELTLDRFIKPDNPARTYIEQIKQAGEQSSALTRQLLAFSRQIVLQPRVLNLNEIIINVNKILKRLIGEDIDLEIALTADLWPVKADPGQIEQVILNLSINARDAMPNGGKLTIETDNIDLDQDYTDHHISVEPGRYVVLALSDTGHGMDAETRSHIFEPFFTTKEPGKGTGLGLATVHGIVTQSGGHIWVYSEVGQGTTFKIYLPRIEEAVEIELPDRTPARSVASSETLLLVEDNEMVRDLAGRILRSLGYTVLEASHGPEALRLIEEYRAPVHLLLTDVVMPGGMNGRELAEQISRRYPDLRVIYMSGYTDNAIIHHGVLEPGMTFLEKPFSPQALTAKIREILDAG